MQDAALKWLVENLKKAGLSEHQAFWIVFPFYFVVIFIGLIVLLSLVISKPWSIAISAWLVLVWACWVPFSPRLFRNEWSAWVTLLFMSVLIIFVLSGLWILAGWRLLRVPFLVGALLVGVTALLHQYKPSLLPRAAQLVGALLFTLISIFLPVYVQQQEEPLVSSPPDRVGIWVARFELDTDGQAQASIIEQLNFVIRDAPLLQAIVEVRDLRRPIIGETEAAQFSLARKLGREVHASLIVFGRVTKQGIATKIAVVSTPFGFSGSDMTMFVRNVNDIPSLDVRATHLIAQVMSGLSYFLRGNCSEAESLFNSALAEIQNVKKVLPPESLRLYQVTSIMCETVTSIEAQRLQKAREIYLDMSKSTVPITAVAGHAGLGLVYRRLAEYEEPIDNLSRAVAAYEQALKAVGAYEQALQTALSDDLPGLIGLLQTNLGVAYEKLSMYRDSDENLSRAVTAHLQSLKGTDADKDPYGYAIKRNNLGVTYKALADHQDPIANLKRAIESYDAALKVLSLNRYRERMRYCEIEGNLGDAYGKLARYKDTATNLSRAVQALNDALTRCGRTENMALYSRVHFNLGRTFIMLWKNNGVPTPNIQTAAISLACSLVTFDELNMFYAHNVAVFFQDYLHDLFPNGDRSKMIVLLQSQPMPSACSFRPEQVLSLIEKWTRK